MGKDVLTLLKPDLFSHHQLLTVLPPPSVKYVFSYRKTSLEQLVNWMDCCFDPCQ